MPYQVMPTSYEAHRDIFVSNVKVIATYTLDHDYVTEATLADGTSRKVLWEGQVLGLNPANSKVVPNYTTYGFAAVGVLIQTIDVQDGDDVVNVAWRGDIDENACTDNGTYGTVLAATKSTLTDRIQFTKKNRL